MLLASASGSTRVVRTLGTNQIKKCLYITRTMYTSRYIKFHSNTFNRYGNKWEFRHAHSETLAFILFVKI